MNSPATLGFDFSADPELNGFRLKRLEVYNWGTFHGKAHVLNLDCRNALLTGETGSGKSTLVDAINTLLVDPRRMSYNKAAGAESDERSLRSYAQGHYKSEKNSSTGNVQAVALRPKDTYSVLLAVFHNEGFDKSVSIAQVYWMKDGKNQPERFYIGIEQELSIANDFSKIADMPALKKRLKLQGAEIEDSYKAYGEWFRRRLGIKSPQALDLFHQTVSMKAVDNLTQFVRTRMLEPIDSSESVKHLVDHFENANRSHEIVITAKRQLKLLKPLVEDHARYVALGLEIENLKGSRLLLAPFFSRKKLALLDERIRELVEQLEAANAQIGLSQDSAVSQQATCDELRQAISANGGDRLEQLAAQIRAHEVTKRTREEKADKFQKLAGELGYPVPSTEEQFGTQRAEFARRKATLKPTIEAMGVEIAETQLAIRAANDEHKTVKAEIAGLKGRDSNIDDFQARIRTALCQSLGLEDSAIPFVGELLQVKAEASAWEGAAERLLHSFGLSLLVPSAHYKEVVEWVDRSSLKSRIVYFHVPERERREVVELHRDSLVNKLDIKASPFAPWLEQELAHRFNVACCETLDQFRRETRAMTLVGQIKDKSGRHEKDDRHAITDRERYVLGWSNEGKIAALEARVSHIQAQFADLNRTSVRLQTEKRTFEGHHDILVELNAYGSFTEIDWPSVVVQIADFQAEQRTLEASSSVLKDLATQLKAAQLKLKAIQDDVNEQLGKRGSLISTLAAARALRVVPENLEDAEAAELASGRVESYVNEICGSEPLTVENCDTRRDGVYRELTKRSEAIGAKRSPLVSKMSVVMTEFKSEFRLESSELDASVEAAPEYVKFYEKLGSDDLPRFEAKFKELLNRNTIDEVATFNAFLRRSAEGILDRVEQLNKSLVEIDYNEGRYIMLVSETGRDQEVAQFQADLKACTEGALTGSDDSQYSEAKFLQVKAIVDRLKGRTNFGEADKRWLTKVTDVRNWYEFAASERYRADKVEHEYYADSGGKSGGQKEKLAYTVLAAGLAYQFDLEWGSVRSKTFRFVMVDEAFGRGSEGSAEYGMRLFKKLKLQVLVATPLQKIAPIEPFVSSVGFVSIENDMYSSVRNISIEKHLQDKALRDAA